jgi:hypothetical protein
MSRYGSVKNKDSVTVLHPNSQSTLELALHRNSQRRQLSRPLSPEFPWLKSCARLDRLLNDMPQPPATGVLGDPITTDKYTCNDTLNFISEFGFA